MIRKYSYRNLFF